MTDLIENTYIFRVHQRCKDLPVVMRGMYADSVSQRNTVLPFSSRVCLLYLQYLQEWSGMHRVCIPADTLSESVALCLLYFCFVLLVLHCKRDLFIHSIFLGLLGTSQSNTAPDWSLDLQCSGSTVYVNFSNRQKSVLAIRWFHF